VQEFLHLAGKGRVAANAQVAFPAQAAALDAGAAEQIAGNESDQRGEGKGPELRWIHGWVLHEKDHKRALLRFYID
jgi:hypothetical protein